jgi:glycosyltransferase involved in cell wall biosynthesis
MREKLIRVLFAIPTLTGGGAERVFTTLLKYLDTERFEPTLVVFNGTDARFRDAIPQGVRVIDLGARRVRHAIRSFIALLWRDRPDLVISTLDHLNMALGMSRPLWPRSVRFIARPSATLSAAFDTKSKLSSENIMMRWLVRAADSIIFQSPEMERDFCRTLELITRKGVVIRNPLEIEIIRAASQAQPPKFCFDTSQFNLVTAGRLVSQKGHDLLLEAFAKLQNPNLALVILGEGPLRQELEVRAHNLGLAKSVRFLGFQTDPFPFFREADGFVLSSRFEGYPNVILEALAVGTPAVATPVAGLSALFSDMPECRLAKDFTPAALAVAIHEFVQQGRIRVQPTAVERFSAPTIVRQYEDLFLRITREKGGLYRS